MADLKPTEHALLSASSSHQWLHCPPSIRLSENIPDEGSVHAKEGTAAHELAALLLDQQFHKSRTKRAFTTARNKAMKVVGEAALATKPEAEKWDEEKRKKQIKAEGKAALAHVTEYLDQVQDACAAYGGKPVVYVEQRVGFGQIVPEGFGTCDCIVVAPKAEGQWILHVFDYKHGKGIPVDAQDNPQLMLYAWGALAMLEPIFPIHDIAMTIVQPRINHITHAETTADALLAWGREISPIAQRAYEGKGEMQAGSWCQFCRFKQYCRVYAAGMLSLERFDYRNPGDPKKPLTSAELSDALITGVQLVKWLTQLREYAEKLLLNGGELPGWKLVEGRSTRMFADQETAFKLVRENGTTEDMLYERTPITLTAVETLLGKKKFNEILKDQIIRAPGKPTLVPESDHRPSLMAGTTAADDFSTL